MEFTSGVVSCPTALPATRRARDDDDFRFEVTGLLTNQQLEVAQATPIFDVYLTEVSRDLGHCSSGFHRGNSLAEIAPVSLRRNAQGKYHITLFRAILLVVLIAATRFLPMSPLKKLFKLRKPLFLLKMRKALKVRGPLLPDLLPHNCIVELTQQPRVQAFNLVLGRVIQSEAPSLRCSLTGGTTGRYAPGAAFGGGIAA
ncbi:hypothetical protein [Columbid circovirus]|uniref:Uncharacterized protein n=1 Tax=Pigeon circovirus TaxID=126070 RepID=A4KBN8_PICV|nr:hypothetical protein [Columbid circovirus]